MIDLGLLLLAVVAFLTLVAHAAVFAGKVAWRGAVGVLSGALAGARRPHGVDLLAAGDHKGVRRARRRRAALPPLHRGGFAVGVTSVFVALAQSCRRYYVD